MWTYHDRAKSPSAGPGKPRDDCHVETINGSLCEECLNVYTFETPGETKAILEAWCPDYNESRPHLALREWVPTEFADQMVPSSPLIEPETLENSL